MRLAAQSPDTHRQLSDDRWLVKPADAPVAKIVSDIFLPQSYRSDLGFTQIKTILKTTIKIDPRIIK